MTNPHSVVLSPTRWVELPEIVHRFGCSIVIWVPTKQGHYYFRANDLVSCSQVCRTWYSVLYPLLWKRYDDSVNVWHFPREVAQANSRHFRHLTLSHAWPASAPIPDQLTTLYLSKKAIGSTVDLLQANPQLASIEIKLSNEHLYEDIQAGLDILTRLKKLRFYADRPDAVHLTQLLRRNPGLQKLLIEGDFDGVGAFMDGEPFADLVEIRLNVNLRLNPGLVHLISYCPNLKAIRFMIYNNGSPAMDLAQSLRENCPKLNSIRCLDADNVDTEGLIQEAGILALIGASSHLTQFEMPLEVFTVDIRDALLIPHATFLEMVHVYMDVCVGPPMANVGKILAGCANLKTFKLYSSSYYTAPLHALALFEEPWICDKLEVFRLKGIGYVVARDYQDHGDVFEHFQRDPDDVEGPGPIDTRVEASGQTEEGASVAETGSGIETDHQEVGQEPIKILSKHGWLAPSWKSEEDKGRLSSRNANVLLRTLLRRTVVMPRMRKVTFNRLSYTKMDS
ncbi:hypothetical protein MVEG_12250 [Podila verticillata NRRL 6337]|uniref:F-box domain-containing protein n=1 Tax=Podila verticillata NRRL 6337 TaxID=1069443 RepID=A0A086TIY9_9FUNG|nr:hypothetical protein MVEG_12250 [Podila verticillata NRRL 6337]